MVINQDCDQPIPVICIDWSAVNAGEVFNTNSWTGISKGVIQSCWTEYSVLDHCAHLIIDICQQRESLCRNQIEEIKGQWRNSKFDWRHCTFRSQNSDLHIYIKAFFTCVKTLLDLLMQLLSSEKIIVVVVDGFHRHKNIYGGTVINALENNAKGNKKQIAQKVVKLLEEHKTLWIDQVILARDNFIHPEKGVYQLMFRLEFEEKMNNLECVEIIPPIVCSYSIDQYVEQTSKNIQIFATLFLEIVGCK